MNERKMSGDDWLNLCFKTARREGQGRQDWRRKRKTCNPYQQTEQMRDTPDKHLHRFNKNTSEI